MRRLLLIFVPGFVIASLLIYAFGDSGLLAYRRLDAYQKTLMANVEKLRSRNSDLNDDLANLRDNPEASLVMARQIGLVRAGDEVVKIEGMAGRPRTYEVGNLIKLPRTKASRNAIFKATGIGISSVLAVFALIARRSSRRNRFGRSRGGS
ncbi:MAG TPA: septum formation initiator family protein [Spirochaetia bacterium]|nr:septum formation initiator family protein [Spirochaetia bacterium]